MMYIIIELLSRDEKIRSKDEKIRSNAGIDSSLRNGRVQATARHKGRAVLGYTVNLIL